MSVVHLTRVPRGSQVRATHPAARFETADILAQVETGAGSVLYLRSGEKCLVRESVEQIGHLEVAAGSRSALVKRFKRALRRRKALGIPLEAAFVISWEELEGRARLDEKNLGELYRELLGWTRRWLG